jgi:hypothetical protein
MSISVGNEGVASLQVSINRWGTSGSTDYFSVTSGAPSSWNRTDDRGFVMAIKRDGTEGKYYVRAGTSIVISRDKVTADGRTIEPVG